MTRISWLLVVVCVFALRAWAGEAVPPENGAKTLESRIAAVTVYADRAQVKRAAQADLAPAGARYAFRGLPGWIDEGSVRVAVTPPEAARILDVEVKKTFLARSGEEEVRKAESAVREIADQLGVLNDEAQALAAEAKQVDSIRAFSLEKLPRDAVLKEIKIESYKEVVTFVGAELRRIAKAQRELEAKRRDLNPELAVRQQKLGELQARVRLEQREVLVTLAPGAPGAARNAAFTLTYMLPGATWEPSHELRAAPDAKTVSLTSFAVVWQTTGEDWTGAELTLSTQHTTETMRIPELEALLVGRGRQLAQTQMKVAQSGESSFKAAEYNRKQNFGTWNVINNPKNMQQAVLDNDAFAEQQQAQARSVFQRLRERGTTAHFQAPAAQTVRTDGRPVRVPIGSVEVAGEQRVIAAPEASLNAARTVDLANTGKQPLLPGKVGLFLQGAFLGATETDFVAQGEVFSMFLGVVDSLKLSRELDRKRSSLEHNGSRSRMNLSFLVTAENLGGEPLALRLTDRLPLSELDEVKVRNVKVLPEVLPDEKGLVHWDVALAPRESRAFRIEYTIDYPADLPSRLGGQQKEMKRGVGEMILEYQGKF